MFSIDTVASSTSMPIDRARPPSVMMLMVLPVIHSASSDASRAIGNVEDHHDHAAPVVQEQQNHQPGQHGADRPLGATLVMASTTVGDSSNS